VSDLVLDASVTLQWLLEDEANRKYSVAVLTSLSEKRALVPLLWFYEVDNALLTAHRRKRISREQIDGFLARLKALPIEVAQESPSDILGLPDLALAYGLSAYDAAYLRLAKQFGLALATNDSQLRRAAAAAGVAIVQA
jgi:predicted nucleic acid-binding protein